MSRPAVALEPLYLGLVSRVQREVILEIPAVGEVFTQIVLTLLFQAFP